MKVDVPLRERCRGRWREILPALGLPSVITNGKHQPCPSCGGRDRFRFTDKEGSGGYICNGCNSGDGFSLAMKALNIDFAEVAKRIEGVIGDLPPPRAETKTMSDEDLRQIRIDLFKESTLMTDSDPVAQYLRSRGLKISGELLKAGALRYAPRCRYGRGEEYPAMIAMVTDAYGKAVTMHRTYLSTMDTGKAKVEQPKKLLPGKCPHGSAIRLYSPAVRMGVAEGIETAIAAAELWGMPVWSAIDAAHLMSWQPPAIARKVYIFGDNDLNYAGQSAAYALAHRLVVKESLEVVVEIPECQGDDFNDVLRRG